MNNTLLSRLYPLSNNEIDICINTLVGDKMPGEKNQRLLQEVITTNNPKIALAMIYMYKYFGKPEAKKLLKSEEEVQNLWSFILKIETSSEDLSLVHIHYQQVSEKY